MKGGLRPNGSHGCLSAHPLVAQVGCSAITELEDLFIFPMRHVARLGVNIIHLHAAEGHIRSHALWMTCCVLSCELVQEAASRLLKQHQLCRRIRQKFTVISLAGIDDGYVVYQKCAAKSDCSALEALKDQRTRAMNSTS